jgi:hypothetical protein
LERIDLFASLERVGFVEPFVAERGKRMLVFFWLCLAVLSAISTPSAWSQQRTDRVALIIGNANYPDASTPLSTTIRDVGTLVEEFRRTGFGVDLKENVGKQEMQRAIDAFMEKIGSGTAALFYFSGYGIQVARQTYLIPVNSRFGRRLKFDGMASVSMRCWPTCTGKGQR